MEDIKVVSLVEYLAKAATGSEVAVIIQAYGQLEDGTPVCIMLPNELQVQMTKLVADRITLPGDNPSIHTVWIDDDED